MRSRLAFTAVLAVVSPVSVLGANLAVVSTSPVRHSFAPANSVISITFDQALMTSSVTASSFRVFGRATGPAGGSVAFSNGDKTLTLTPGHAFSAGEIVVVNLSHDVKAADATPLRSAGYAFEFTVAATSGTRSFQQIDSMSNRSSGAQTRIYGAVAADLDSDGWVDLATVNEVSADLRVFMNKGDGSGLYDSFLHPPFDIGLEASPNEPADFDNDGKIDIVVSAAIGGGVWIAHGDGDGTFSGSQSVSTGSEPHGVAVLDVDGDGDWDIVDAVYGDNTLALLLNDGAGNFGAPSYISPVCDGPWALGQADMNDDGIFDVVAGCPDDDGAAVLLGNGDGTFTPGPEQSAGGSPWQVALGDVDGDGNIDAAFGNSFSSNGGLLRGNGDGTLDAPVTVPVPGHTPASDLADLDGDGDLDWILSSFGAGLWRIYINDGNGNFSFDQDIAADNNPSCAVPVDFDNDGDIDLALSDEIADLVGLWQNQSGPNPICPPAPASCRTTGSGKASFSLADRSPDTADQLQWKWSKGPTTLKAEFGSPLTTDEFALCIYNAGALLTSVSAPGGGTCGTKPCWKDTPSGYAYKSKGASITGVTAVALKQGTTDGKAQLSVKGKGLKLPMPDLDDLTGPVIVQLQRSGGAPCFGAIFSAPFQKSGSAAFKDKSD